MYIPMCLCRATCPGGGDRVAVAVAAVTDTEGKRDKRQTNKSTSSVLFDRGRARGGVCHLGLEKAALLQPASP